MPKISGPVRLSRSQGSVLDLLKKKKIKIRLPFEAKDWKSKHNSDLVSGKELKPKVKPKPKAKPRRRKK